MLRLASVVGVRPQFVKAAVVARALQELPGVEEFLIHTGQHYDDMLSAVFFDELEIPRPRHELGVGSASHGAQTGRMLERIEEVLIEERPDGLLVYGDTNSTLAGALAAAKLHIPVAHVEAGLRSFNRKMPEEVNRVLTDHLSELLFCPSAPAVEQLRAEGVPAGKIHLVGDVMYDAAIQHATRAQEKSRILDTVGLATRSYVLATVHRPETTDDAACLEAVFEGLGRLSRSHDLAVVVPLHPRTRAALERHGLLATASDHLHIIEPVGYLDMLELTRNARLVATDSGGLQKEAFFCSVPCVTLRTETEWVELLEVGWNKLLPPSTADEIHAGLTAGLELGGSALAHRELFGGGEAAKQVAGILHERLSAAGDAVGRSVDSDQRVSTQPGVEKNPQ